MSNKLKLDNVNHPSHYNNHPSGIECIDIVRYMNFNLGNAFKYVFRRNDKDSKNINLQKAIWYIKDEIFRRTSLERWKVWPSDDRYEVSTLGRIRYIGRIQCRKLVPIKSGYMTFIVTRFGIHYCYYIHRVVVETFVNNFDVNMDIRHRNGDRTDNCLANLLYGTALDNRKDKIWNRTDYNGKRNPSVFLTEQQVQDIRLLKGTDTQVNIGLQFKVSGATIGRIWRGEAWQDKTPIPFLLTEEIITYESNNIGEILMGLVKASWTKSTIEILEDIVTRLDLELTRGEDCDNTL